MSWTGSLEGGSSLLPPAPKSLRSPRCDSGHPTHTGVPEFGARSPFCNKKNLHGTSTTGSSFPKTLLLQRARAQERQQRGEGRLLETFAGIPATVFTRAASLRSTPCPISTGRSHLLAFALNSAALISTSRRFSSSDRNPCPQQHGNRAAKPRKSRLQRPCCPPAPPGAVLQQLLFPEAFSGEILKPKFLLRASAEALVEISPGEAGGDISGARGSRARARRTANSWHQDTKLRLWEDFSPNFARIWAHSSSPPPPVVPQLLQQAKKKPTTRARVF